MRPPFIDRGQQRVDRVGVADLVVIRFEIERRPGVFTFVAVGNDISLLAKGSEALVQTFKGNSD